MTVALLTASGTGSRMGQDIPKQFLHVKDKPVIIYTLERFQNNPQIDAIVLVTLPNWFGFVEAYAAQFGISKLKWIVAGGETGQESIRNGLEAIAKDCPEDTTVMIHDGNRPMVDNNIISDSLAVFRQYGSAVAVIPCTEAIFRSEDGKTSTVSIPREALLRTQTPHTYTLKKLLWAHEQAKLRGITNQAASCTLMHELGETVYFSRGSEKNFKLTTLDDLEIFNAFLDAEKKNWLK
ncbi:MAG: 2-C-methyl-D-erythritol 4-phosphate cytidylyltransferase [Ruminococcaceae bacterium]|nr:2-C-methyl-D-erythritol 4-phosphate cytidylyltransferase [Oscillospiraceae bacterium]